MIYIGSMLIRRNIAHFEMFKIIYLKVLYRSKSVVKSGSIFKPRYIRFRDISDRVYSVYPMFKRS